MVVESTHSSPVEDTREGIPMEHSLAYSSNIDAKPSEKSAFGSREGSEESKSSSTAKDLEDSSPSVENKDSAPSLEDEGPSPSPESALDVGAEKPSWRTEVTLPVVGRLVWRDLMIAGIAWISDPLNIALLLWIIAVAVAGGMLFLVMTGMVNTLIPNAENRKIWGEALNQVLTALFTLYVLLVQPWRIVYVIRVIRWEQKDRRRLRVVLSRGGPDEELSHERFHFSVVVTLLMLNCAFQYCLAGVMWGIRMENRSGILVGTLLAGAIGSVALAGLYSLFSPLGRPKPPVTQMTLPRSVLDSFQGRSAASVSALLDQEVEGGDSPEAGTASTAKSASLRGDSEGDEMVTMPIRDDLEWNGSLLSCFDDMRVMWHSLFCFCCSFGASLEAAGFGSKYLHTVMLLLFLAAPLLICEFAAFQVGNHNMAIALIVAGAVISCLGLLYGGYWRYQLVKVFRLPPLCAPKNSPWAGVGDCFLWLGCCFCALCQEVRTVKGYGLHVDYDEATGEIGSGADVLRKLTSDASGHAQGTAMGPGIQRVSSATMVVSSSKLLATDVPPSQSMEVINSH